MDHWHCRQMSYAASLAIQQVGGLWEHDEEGYFIVFPEAVVVEERPYGLRLVVSGILGTDLLLLGYPLS